MFAHKICVRLVIMFQLMVYCVSFLACFNYGLVEAWINIIDGIFFNGWVNVIYLQIATAHWY